MFLSLRRFSSSSLFPARFTLRFTLHEKKFLICSQNESTFGGAKQKLTNII